MDLPLSYRRAVVTLVTDGIDRVAMPVGRPDACGRRERSRAGGHRGSPISVAQTVDVPTIAPDGAGM